GVGVDGEFPPAVEVGPLGTLHHGAGIAVAVGGWFFGNHRWNSPILNSALAFGRMFTVSQSSCLGLSCLRSSANGRGATGRKKTGSVPHDRPHRTRFPCV